MKNLLGAAALTAVVALSLTACGSSGGSTSSLLPTGVVPKSTATPGATASPSPIASPTPVATNTPAPTATPVPTPTPVPLWLTQADQNIQPTLICIGHRPWDGRYFLRFGYNSNESSAVQIAIDGVYGTTQLNHVIVTPVSGDAPYEVTGQPTLFLTGSGNVAFDVPVFQKDQVAWYLDGNVLNATTNGAVQCP